MPFWSGQTLLDRASKEQLIVPFNKERISCSAYELTVGSEAFVTRDKTDQSAELAQGRTPGHLQVDEKGSICIPSGQFAMLITEERIKIPADSLGFISIKASKKWQGLVNVSGFHVDPGWDDRLIFGVFNAGPQTIVIKPKEAFFLLFFAALNEPAEEAYQYKNGYDFSTIPSKLMQGLSAAVPTVYKLNENVKELREDAKSAQNRSNIAITIAALAVTVALGTFTRAIGLLPLNFGGGSSAAAPPSVSAPVVDQPAANIPAQAVPEAPAGQPVTSPQQPAKEATVKETDGNQPRPARNN
jgi:dCTP deaminase